uniref:Uncharacterized protein n=1 Tax=Rhizophora mucronata TaxID=61149 RepID=A0A2P2PVP9_RHIMU
MNKTYKKHSNLLLFITDIYFSCKID